VTPASLRVLLRRVSWRKLAIFILSFMIFALALELMKTGARGLAPLVRNLLRVDNPLDGLGLGWLSAYALMSGSPVAAAALTFYDASVLDQVSAFFMITGSRLGASMIVLLVGVLYVLRGHDRTASLTTGVLALVVTAVIYLPALPIGYFVMSSHLFDRVVEVDPNGALISAFDWLFGPPVKLVADLLPEWGVFLVGLGIIVGSFNLFDNALPKLSLKDGAFSGIARLLYRPIVTFALGFALTLVTMSVSVSLGLLVPLSARGYVRRENLIPYIMGCNISTFIDTLVAGLVLGNPGAAAIVLAQMLSVLVVSMIVLIFFFTPFERAILRVVTEVSKTKRRLIVFFLTSFLVPLVLLLVG
jgi:Na+/phosphate symporter